MNQYILYIKTWYENRQLREKILVVALSWAFLYAIFSLVFFRPLDTQQIILLNDIKEENNQIHSWQIQIEAINKIPSTPLYKEWIKHKQLLQNLHGKYKFALLKAPPKQWENIIKTILQSQSSITLAEIKNLPETIYNPLGLSNLPTTIYQQQLTIVFYSHFNDTINYITRLENLFPNIHWDTLIYEVVQYPIAKVQMEFSIIYEKD